MPQLSDLVQKRKFVKKEYRPWDLSGTGTVDGKEADIHTLSEGTAAAPVETKPDLIGKLAVKQASVTPTNSINQDTSVETGNDLGNKLDNNKVTNRQPTGNIRVTNNELIGNIQVSIREQTDNEIGNELGNKNDLAYLIKAAKKLTGIQKNIFYYVINICSARESLETGILFSNDLARAANCTVGSVKTSLIRLIEKQLMLRLEGKPSRGGHLILGITKEIQVAAIQAQQALFKPPKGLLTGNEMGNELDNNSYYSSSSSNNNINTTTTVLPDSWKIINFESLQPIGFSQTQLRQLFDSKMTEPAIIQDSINKFAFSLEHNEKTKAYPDPLNILMGVLRKGHRWNEPNYIAPKELALQQLLEEKRKQKEKHDKLIKEYLELEFPDWRRKLTADQIKQIVPAEILKANLAPAITAALRTYFIENVLPTKLDLEDSNALSTHFS